ncbi:tRNA pseudouridine synthase A [Bienertia sinuspersici]
MSLEGSDAESTPSYSGDHQRLPKVQRIEEQEQDFEVEFGESVANMKRPQKPGLQRYLVAFEYIGTRFYGSQQQTNQRTAVGVLQEAFQKFVGQQVSIFCSSRTDAGVHALSNVCHVDVERISKRKPDEVLQPHEPSVVRRAVNHFLQREGDIMVIEVRSVPFDFHARYKAQERTYYYRLLSGPESLSMFERDRAWHVPEELNLQAMQEACKVLVGHHDFSSFRATGCQAKSPIRTLDELHVTESFSAPYFPSFAERELSSFGTGDSFKWADNPDANVVDASSYSRKELNRSGQGFGIRSGHHCLVVKTRARSFLYHQVRLLVGVLKCVGTGHLTVTDVERILNARTVTAASPMAPACGLYLGHVKYDLD